MARHGAESTSYDVETGYRDQQTGKGDEMNAFFERVSDIKADMNEIQAKQRQIQAMNERSKSIVRPKEMQQIRQDMQVTINEVSAVAHKVKSKVEALDKLNEAALQKKGQGIGTASERTRTSITAGLKKKLKDMMGEFSDLRARIHDEYRDVVERRVYTVTGQHLPEDDIDRMIDTGKMGLRTGPTCAILSQRTSKSMLTRGVTCETKLQQNMHPSGNAAAVCEIYIYSAENNSLS